MRRVATVKATTLWPTGRQREIFDHLVGFEVISALNLLWIVWPNELKFSATITKAPGPPITLLR